MRILKPTFFGAAAAALALFCAPVQAHRVYPMSYELAPVGSGAATV